MMHGKVTPKDTFAIMCLLAINLFFLVVSVASPGFVDSAWASAEIEGRFELSVSDGLVSLDAKNADLQSVLSEISDKTGLQIESPKKLNHRYRYMSGTSMATPVVSGIAGLIWSLNPHPTNLEVKDIILNSIDSLESLNGMVLTGGRVNANNALLHAME